MKEEERQIVENNRADIPGIVEDASDGALIRRKCPQNAHFSMDPSFHGELSTCSDRLFTLPFPLPSTSSP
jgi:hypothetical protein